jgi:hypothetical protein
MGGLFGGGGGGGGGAAQEQLNIQKQQIAKQEENLAKQETDLAKRTQAGMKARRGGGLRSLLSAERTDSELGIGNSTKLGGGA